MPSPTTRRGLQTVRTQSTRKANANLSGPELYIRLTSLEMERTRRVTERDRLLERVRILDQRIHEINDEQHNFRARIDRANAQNQLLAEDPASGSSGSNSSGFGFTY